MSFRYILFLLFCLPFLAFGATKQQMLNELEFIKGVFEAKYAPIQWKENLLGFHLDEEVALAAAKIQDLRPGDLAGYHQILKSFFESTSDYHVGVHFYATEEATLPFQVRGAEGRYFIVDIDRTALPFSKFPFSVGDEIVSFDGQPIDRTVEELKREELGQNSPRTDQILAEILLTSRQAEHGNRIPSGSVEIGVIRKDQPGVKRAVIDWYYVPEKISLSGQPKPAGWNDYSAWRLHPRESIRKEKFFEKFMLFHGWNRSHVGVSLMSHSHALGARSSFLPALGRKIWSSKRDAIFDAYIFKLGSQSIGYIRIPHYMGDEEEVEEFCETMKIFQRSTDALVIDQVNNPGGSVFYTYALVAALTANGQELATPKHRLMLTQEEVYMAISVLDALEGVSNVRDAKEVIGDTLGGYPVSLEMIDLIHDFCHFILDQWSENKIFTDPTHLFGVDRITSHPGGHYTKPILLLTNALDFSAGDFFPAILQDAGRAKVLGVKTAGAGGYVMATQYPNATGVLGFHLTASIAEREEGKKIENLGVDPDIEYELTPFDFQNCYQQYREKIIDAVQSLI